MMTEAIAYARRYHACQIHVDFVHQPPEQLHPTDSMWPFEMWGMDIMGPISPPSAKGHRFILAVTNYFSKWAEAIPLREVKTSDVIQFIKHHVIYRFVSPDGSCMITGRNSSAILSSGFVLNSEYKAYPPQHITRQPMASLKPSTKLSGNCSRSSSLVPNAIGTKSSGSVFGRTVLRYELRQRLLLSPWSMEQRLSSLWKSRSRLFGSPWHLR